VWTADEKVVLFLAFTLLARWANTGADWSKKDLWDNIKVVSDGRTPERLQPGDPEGRWPEPMAASMQTHFVRKIAPDVHRFTYLFKVVSGEKQMTGGLTEGEFVRAAADRFSGVSAHQAVRQDAWDDMKDAKRRSTSNGVQYDRTLRVWGCCARCRGPVCVGPRTKYIDPGGSGRDSGSANEHTILNRCSRQFEINIDPRFGGLLGRPGSIRPPSSPSTTFTSVVVAVETAGHPIVLPGPLTVCSCTIVSRPSTKPAPFHV